MFPFLNWGNSNKVSLFFFFFFPLLFLSSSFSFVFQEWEREKWVKREREASEEWFWSKVSGRRENRGSRIKGKILSFHFHSLPPFFLCFSLPSLHSLSYRSLFIHSLSLSSFSLPNCLIEMMRRNRKWWGNYKWVRTEEKGKGVYYLYPAH